MIVTNRIRNFLLAAAALALLTGAARARDYDNDRRGLMLGFNVAGGGAELTYRALGAEVKREIEGGSGAAVRLGFGLSDHVVLGIEAHGMRKEDSLTDLEAGAAMVTVTWFPGGGGFFLRAGAGTGITTLRLDQAPTVDWVEREGDAGMFGLGYEWRLGRQFALGVALDGIVTEYEDLGGFVDTEFGFGAASLQLNWYL